MQKSVWIFGTIAGISCALFEYLFFKSNAANATTMFLAKLLILVFCIGLGVILAKKLNGGTISIARTLLTGTMIAVVRSVIMIASFLFLYYPNGDFYKDKVNISYEQAAKKIESDETIKPADKQMVLEETRSQIKNQYEPAGYALISMGSSIITGLIISIFMAAFVSTNMMYKDESRN